jgi:hypothetical protein
MGYLGEGAFDTDQWPVGLFDPDLILDYAWGDQNLLAVPPPTFAEFLKWPDRREIVLAELTPSLTLLDWTPHSVAPVVTPASYAALFDSLAADNDPNGKYLSHADNADLSAGDIDYTWSLWAYLSDKNDAMSFVSKIASTWAQDIDYRIRYWPGASGIPYKADRIRFEVGNLTGGDAVVAIADSFGSPPAEQWIFIVAWYDSAADTMNIQINDGPVDSVTKAGGGVDVSASFLLGRSEKMIYTSSNTYAHLRGNMHSVRFWKRLLTPAERTALYNGGERKRYADLTAGEKTSMISSWELEEASGTRNDSHGANHLTDNGGVGRYTIAEAETHDEGSYSTPLSRVFTVPAISGGVYRRAVGVRENASDLAERASAALVTANKGSWFWDEAAGLLYVQSTGGDIPSNYAAVQAFTTLYVASAGIVLNRVDGDPSTGIYYQPWLVGEIPRLSQEMEDPLSGAKLTESGAIAFRNAGHGFWNTAIPSLNWKNKRVRLYLGGSYNGQDLPRSEYLQLAAMLIDDAAPSEEEARLILKPLPRLLDRTLPRTPLFEDEYANLGQGVRGTKKWIGYGRATIKPDLVDTTVTGGKWLVADAAYQTLFAVNAVFTVAKTTGVRTQLTSAEYTADLANCTVTLISAYPWEDYDIVVDASGKPDGAGSYLKYAGEIVKDILVTHLAAKVGDLDAASFTDADAANQVEIAVWLKSERQIASILATAEPSLPSIERSVMGTLRQTLDGKWSWSIWDPGYDPATLVSLRKEDFARFDPDPKLESVFSTVRVHYNHDPALDEWDVATAQSLVTEYLSESNDAVDVYTYLRAQGEAVILAQRYQVISGYGALEVEFEERGALLARHLAGEKVLATYSPAPTLGGAFDAKPFELIRIDRSLSDMLTIGGRLGDLRGIGSRIHHWAPDEIPDYAGATQAQRDRYGFWSADGGTTRSVWW